MRANFSSHKGASVCSRPRDVLESPECIRANGEGTGYSTVETGPRTAATSTPPPLACVCHAIEHVATLPSPASHGLISRGNIPPFFLFLVFSPPLFSLPVPPSWRHTRATGQRDSGFPLAAASGSSCEDRHHAADRHDGFPPAAIGFSSLDMVGPRWQFRT